MRLGLLAVIISSWAHLAGAAPVEEFIPTEEWQFVPQGVAIPGGLEIKMDLDKGGRWARYPPGGKKTSGTKNVPGNKKASDNKKVSGNKKTSETDKSPAMIIQDQARRSNVVMGDVYLTDDNLDKLEEMAYDRHYGVDILRDYGYTLVNLYTSAGPNSEDAGRILGVCLRNNEAAAKMFIPLVHKLLPRLEALQKRPIMLLTALVTTPDGFESVKCTSILENLRKRLSLSKSKLDESVSTALSNLITNLAVYGEEVDEICKWASICSASSTPALKELARNIYKRNEVFAEIRCPKK